MTLRLTTRCTLRTAAASTAAASTAAASTVAAGAALALAACDTSTAPLAAASGDVTKVNHVVVIYLENRSFDNTYGEFAGADGLSAGAARDATRRDRPRVHDAAAGHRLAGAEYADGTPGRAAHLKDEADFIAAAGAGAFPAVSFVKPLGVNNEHPGYADVLTGENHTLALINAVRNGPNWKDAAIIITYDENGGFWDHVAPPAVDEWGPGTRVPALIISPFAKKGYVDHTTYETASILAFLEKRYALPPLSTHDARAANLTTAFDFSQTP